METRPIMTSNQGRRAIETLEARAAVPQTVLRLWLIVYITVNSITLCITLNAKTGKIGLVLVTLCIQTQWLFCSLMFVWYETPTLLLEARFLA